MWHVYPFGKRKINHRSFAALRDLQNPKIRGLLYENIFNRTSYTE